MSFTGGEEPYWRSLEDQFPTDEERFAAALADKEVVKAAQQALFGSLTGISGDDRLALERLMAEKHGLAPEDVQELVIHFARNQERNDGFS